MSFRDPTRGAADRRTRRAMDQAARAGRVPHTSQTKTAITADRSWTSTTPAAIPTDACQVVGFVKYFDDTNLLCSVDLPRCYASGAAACSAQIYVRVNGTNYEAIDFAAAYTTDSRGYSGSVLISDIPKGTYTLEVYGSRDINTWTIANGTTVTLTVTETR